MFKLLLAILLLNCKLMTAQCWVQVVSENDQIFGLRSDSSLWAWGGGNDVGQSGICTFSGTQMPVMVGDTTMKWIGLSYKKYGFIALNKDGCLWAWGLNFQNRLVDSTLVNLPCPTRVDNDFDWKMGSVGSAHSLAIKSNGSLWAWGDNIFGQLGDGSLVDKAAPIQIGADKDWSQVSADESISFAIKKNGTLWAWGSNWKGRLGDGSTTNSSIPIQIGGDTDWLSIQSGVTYTMAIKTDGSLWGWGLNYSGQIGNGTNIDILTPTQIGVDTDWKEIDLHGSNHSFGIKHDGSLWAWGYNQNGELGDGTRVDRLFPVRIGVDSNWVSASGGLKSSHAVTSNGDLMQVDSHYLFSEILPLAGCADFSILSLEPDFIDVQLFPNPAVDQLALEFKVVQHSEFIIRLTDINGRALYFEKFEVGPGLQRKDLMLNGFPAGIYILNLASGHDEIRLKVVKN